ncbi:MAG: hypothetical protein JWM83_701 [Candidatus Angelobacter sp.]|nr:hypothetical protein [Candidatus Angelobacter sp.]
MQSDVLFFHPDEGSVAVNKFSQLLNPQDIELFVLDVVFPFFSVSFRQERLRGLLVRSHGYLFRNKQRSCLESQVRLQATGCRRRLLLRHALVNWIGLAASAVY